MRPVDYTLLLRSPVRPVDYKDNLLEKVQFSSFFPLKWSQIRSQWSSFEWHLKTKLIWPVYRRIMLLFGMAAMPIPLLFGSLDHRYA